MFPVRYELSFYILIIRYSVFKGLREGKKTFACGPQPVALVRYAISIQCSA
jgi:hypothetical protein